MACYIYICGGGGSFILVVRPWRGVVMGVASTQRSGLGSNILNTNTLKNSNTNTFLDAVFQLQIQILLNCITITVGKAVHGK